MTPFVCTDRLGPMSDFVQSGRITEAKQVLDALGDRAEPKPFQQEILEALGAERQRGMRVLQHE